jgi:hypothetical protein
MKCVRSIVWGVAITLAAAAGFAAGVVGTGTAGSCTESAFDTALTGGGSVTFNCGGGPVTITFSTTKTITIATTIDGANLITLSGGGSVKLFDVTGGGLTVDNLALINGHDTASDIGSAAINASAAVTISGSTISGHHVTHGGCPAIVTSGALTITNSTISGNVNEAAAAGFAVCGNNTSTMTVQDSTFSGNTGGAINTSGTATLTNVTIAGNSSTGSGNTGGIEVFGGSLTLVDSIVANNTGVGQCAAIVSGTITDGGNNLQFPGTTCGATIPSLDPLLGPLANNGGPTFTMALLPGSPAVDAGNNATCLPTDQRGQARTDGDGNGTVVCDIGAYEAPAGINVVVSPPTITKAFGAATIPLNGTASLSFTIANPNTGTSLSGVGFSDTLPSGLVVSTPNGLTGSCDSGTITAVAGSSSISLLGATLAGSGSCTFSINVTGTTAGPLNNVTSSVTSNEGGTGGTASASVTVEPPVAVPTLGSGALFSLFLLLAAAGWFAIKNTIQ